MDKITEVEYDFIQENNANWKCNECDGKKINRGDNTPLTPLSEKNFPSFKGSGSDADSETNFPVATGGTGTVIKQLCGKCNKGFAFNAHRLSCIICKLQYHLKCTKVPKGELDKVQSKWTCTKCNVQGDVTSGAADRPSADKKETSDDVTLKVLLDEMRSFRTEVHNTHKELTDNMAKHSDWVEELSKNVENIGKKMDELTLDISNVRQENVNLRKQVSELSEKLSMLEQAAKDNVLEIQGVPCERDENLIDVISKISDAIGFQFSASMIDNCYRFKSSQNVDKPGGIVVRFVRKIDMNGFIKKRKEKRNLNSRDLGFMAGNATVIYVNSSLTPDKRKILRAARQCKRDKQYTFVWVSGGRILMRKNQGDPAVEIKSEEDLEKLN